MFVFRKKNKPSKEIDQLLSLLENDPENTKNRVRLADLYLRAGAKKSAIREYQKAATYLSEEGFNLKAISIYKKIVSLDGMSLSSYKSLASLYTAEGFLAEARRTYEKVLQVKPRDEETQEALRELERDEETPPDKQTENRLEEGETKAKGDSDAVSIETPAASQDQETDSDPSTSLLGKTLEQMDVGDFSANRETPVCGASPDREEDPVIDIETLQSDDALETTQSVHEEETDARVSLHGRLLRDLEAEDLTDAPPPAEKISPLPPGLSALDCPQPSPSNSTADSFEPSGADPNLHYHLGVAYREMELIDRAIEEFTKALGQGTKSLECLIMLARCYFEKGLFRDATDFIHRALKLEDLTQDQIDLLHRQLEEVEAVGKLG